MARSPSSTGDKPLHWVGSSKRDFLDFLAQVRSDMGYALGLAQIGGKHPHAKPWKGEGAGVLEVVENSDGDTFRAVYTVRFAGVVYVLHAFQKKKSFWKTHGDDGRGFDRRAAETCPARL